MEDMQPTDVVEQPDTALTETPDPVEAPAAPEGAPPEPEPAPYEPNLEFTVKDEKHQFDEQFKDWVTNKEREDQLRDLYTRAYGLDGVKSKYQEARERLEPLESLNTTWNQLNEMYKAGDYTNFFKGLGVSKDAVYKYAQELLQYNDLTPEERAEYDRSVTERSELANLRQEVSSLKDAQYQSAVTTRSQELTSALASPDVAQIVDKYDAVHGSGSFYELARTTGANHYASTGYDPSVGEVIGHLKSQFGVFMTEQQAAPQNPMGTVNAPQAKPVIPNINGREGSTPTAKEVRSVDQLRKIYNQKFSE